MQILRSAQVPMSVADISEGVALDLDLPMQNRKDRQQVWANTYNTLRRLEANDSVINFDSTPSLWLLALKSH